LLEVVLARQIYGRPFAAPPGVPTTAAKTLQDAFAQMAIDKAFLADADKRQAEITFNSGEEIRALVERVYASPRPLIERAIVELNKAGE
jgi:tripartite-type tricarboxylate transporter receptor subunit TctC